MRAILIPLLLCLMLAVSLSACGNKGPLVLPEEDKKSKQTG